ncbi:MAG: HAD family hydrolase [Bacteroidales bacterium]|nr:MAG: HAD family hydrolase [Bacteroidales bacterium]
MSRNFEFVLFDMIGTTIKDSYNGESLILDCFYNSFCSNGFQISYEQINQQRGRSKKEAIKNILIGSDHKIDLIDKIYLDFMGSLNKSLDCFTEMNGASVIFELLKEKGIKIGLGSGLPLDFMYGIIKQVNWQIDSFDYIGSSEELGKGRPNPIMILDLMVKFKIADKTKVLKIGDTIVDIQEGKNAGVITAGVLTGSQKREELEKFQPDYIFSDISEIKTLI